MKLPNIPLFDWLIEHMPNTKFDLANSSITGVEFSELLEYTDFEINNDLNLGKNDPFGAMPLRETLANIYNCDIKNVIPTTGGSEANFLVFLAMLEKGDEVIVEQPGYSPLWLVPQMLGATVKFWPRTLQAGFSLDIQKLQELITKKTKLVVITNLHNPSGVLANESTLKDAAEICSEYGAILFIDEMFLDVSNNPQNTAFGMDSVLVTASVSKVYGIGGLRTGWIIADDMAAKRCLKAKWQASVAAPYLSELLSAAALSKARDILINRCKNIAHDNFPIIKDFIKDHDEQLAWVPPDGGIMCYPKFGSQKYKSSLEFCTKLIQETGVLLSPGEYFGLDGHFRLTFMNHKGELKTALDILAKLLH